MKICSKEECTGCSACYNICPVEAISMIYDEEGFLFPRVDSDKCISCCKCKIVCPSVNTIQNDNYKRPKTIGCFHENSKIVKKSSSGGVFMAIAEYVLENNGVIIACKMDETLIPYHDIAENIESARLFQGSKYLQGEVRSSYKTAKSYLEKGNKVLYVGLPCQIAGLKAFLDKCKICINKLITVDLVCHGIGSRKFFDKYINEIQTTEKQKVVKYEFRTKDKKIGIGFTSKIVFKNGHKSFMAAVDNPYITCYLQKLIYRESCYKCHYAKIPRIADITIGDFMGIEKSIFSKVDNNNGISLILLNNSKAEWIFNEFKNNLIYAYRPLEEALHTNYNISNPSIRPIFRDSILKAEQDTKILCNRYCKNLWKMKLANILGKNFINFYKIISGK